MLSRLTKHAFLVLSLCAGPLSAGVITAISPAGPGGLYEIPDEDPNGITIPITIADARFVEAAGQNVTLTILGMNHSFLGDLQVVLTFRGIAVISSTVFSRVGESVNTPGGSPANLFGDYAFSSAFGGDFWAAAAAESDSSDVPQGNYYPTNAGNIANNLSSAFNGQAVAGDWELTIIDRGAGDLGDVVGFRLDINVADTAPVPEPASIELAASALAAGALVGLLRRRRSSSSSRRTVQ